MPVFFEDPQFTVRQPLLGGWRITDKERGSTLVPQAQLREKISLIWMQIRRDFRRDPELRREMENRMFHHFARATADTRSPSWIALIELPTRDFISLCEYEVEKALSVWILRGPDGKPI